MRSVAHTNVVAVRAGNMRCDAAYSFEESLRLKYDIDLKSHGASVPELLLALTRRESGVCLPHPHPPPRGASGHRTLTVPHDDARSLASTYNRLTYSACRSAALPASPLTISTTPFSSTQRCHSERAAGRARGSVLLAAMLVDGLEAAAAGAGVCSSAVTSAGVSFLS